MDDRFARNLVFVLGGVCALCLCGLVLLAGLGREPPAALGSIAAVTAGVLAGIPIGPPTRSSGGGPAPSAS